MLALTIIEVYRDRQIRHRTLYPALQAK